MGDLRKVKEALEFFSELSNYCAELKGGVRPSFDFEHTPIHDKGYEKAKEALAELTEFMENDIFICVNIDNVLQGGTYKIKRIIIKDDGKEGTFYKNGVRWCRQPDGEEFVIKDYAPNLEEKWEAEQLLVDSICSKLLEKTKQQST